MIGAVPMLLASAESTENRFYSNDFNINGDLSKITRDFNLYYDTPDKWENSLADRVFDLIDDSVVGLYAVCETDSHGICNAAIRADRPSLRVVGCDLGAFNRENLDKGVFTCIIYRTFSFNTLIRICFVIKKYFEHYFIGTWLSCNDCKRC